MKTSVIVLFGVLLAAKLFAQGSAFTYQGLLSENGARFSGTVELEATLWDQATNGTPILAPRPVTRTVEATNGLFSASLDFGKAAFTGAQRWLQIHLRTSPDPTPFTTLWPRQEIMATPHAMVAEHLTGRVISENLVGSYGNVVAFHNPGNFFVGQGSELVNLNASQLSSGIVPAAALGNAWQLGGNAGTTPGTHFLGTTDDQPLELKANGLRALRLEPGGGLAAGHRAQASHTGAFVWADSVDSDFGSTATNQFSVRAGGGVRFVTGGVGVTLDGQTVLSGMIGPAQLANSAVSSSAIANGAITAIDVAVASFSTTFWKADGNTGTTPGPHFLGTTDNQPLEFKVNGLRALRLEPTGDSINDFDSLPDGAPNVIGGAPNNLVLAGAVGSTIAGGGATNFGGIAFPNSIAGDFAAIGGGRQNTIQFRANNCTIGGGYFNTIETNADSSVIAGGTENTIQAGVDRGTIGGGYLNSIESASSSSIIAGGVLNKIKFDADWNSIGGGSDNVIFSHARFNMIGGGGNNEIGTNTVSGVIAGGGSNVIESNVVSSSIGGGQANTIQANAIQCVIAGGAQNTIQTAAVASSIGGGKGNRIQWSADFSSIGGGATNMIQTNADWSTISGGQDNTIQTNANWASIAGGQLNVIQLNADWSSIGGGNRNTIQAGSFYNTIAGGGLNTIQAGADYSFIGGGQANVIQAGGQHNVIGGGTGNTIHTNALSSFIGSGNGNVIQTNVVNGTIGGGVQNTIQSNVFSGTIAGGSANRIQFDADRSTIGGGFLNQIRPNAEFATIPGGRENAATNYAFAAGRRAQAINQGAFVWGDSVDANISSTNNNSVTMRAGGGYRLFSNGAANAGVYLAPNSGGWVAMSDRHAKEHFEPVNPRAVLAKVAALPVSTWNYKSQTNGVRHIGVMAQDFQAAFRVGETDTGINTVDADGVALAAIQGLNQKLEEKDAEIRELRQTLAELKDLIQNERR